MGTMEELTVFQEMRKEQMDESVSVELGPQVNARLSFERRGGPNKPDAFGHYKTYASDLFFTYPLKLMLPAYASSSNCQWVYSINFGGGIVSGDNVEIHLDVQDSCCALLTTQASTKVYHSENGMTSQQKLQGHVGAGSLLAVLQDPVTCYALARYRQTQSFDVSENGSLVFMDWLSAGRIARGERWDFTSYSSSNSVTFNGTLIYRDSIHLEDTPLLSVKKTMQAYNVVASCVLVGPAVAGIAQDMLSTYGGMRDYGAKQNANVTIGVSPIEKTVNGETVHGAVIKFASTSVSEVYSKVEELLHPLFPTLGGNPFEDKH
ncbi:uncharacterized protein [Diadema antillarum]|uniref:uncharacterized protein n=1 Tax=Diadema antillarum TaxID=105358 RepID=UPI003A838688